MENYKVSINPNNEDDIYDELIETFKITFTNDFGVKLFEFVFDITIIYIKNLLRTTCCHNCEEEIDAFNEFVKSLNDNTDGKLYFDAENSIGGGYGIISFNDGYMKFITSVERINSEFIVKITEDLKNEFKKITQILTDWQIRQKDEDEEI